MYKEKEIFYRIHSWSFGDTLAATPTLRRLYYAYGNKLNVVTNSKGVFQDNPYVKSIISFDEFDSLDLKNVDHEVLDSFTHPGRKDERGIEKKYSVIDIRQLHAMDLGFQLLPEQMSYDYYPPAKEHKWELPSEYVVLHVTSNWANRTWSYSNWDNLIKWLAKNKIFTVTVGMDYKEAMHSSISDDSLVKKCPKFNNIYGLDLTNQGSLYDMWHIINDASLIVTMASGPLHLAGTTDTQIIQLGSALHWRFRAPYRNGTQEYKYEYIGSSCQLFCNSNLFYNVETWGTINAIPPMVDCRENKETYECHPSYNKVIEVLKNYLDWDSTLLPAISMRDYKDGKLTYTINKNIPHYEIEAVDIATGLLRGSLTGSVTTGNYWWVPAPGNETEKKSNLGGVDFFVTIMSDKVYREKYTFDSPGGTQIVVNGNNITYTNNIKDPAYPTFWEVFINDEYELDNFSGTSEYENGIVIDIGSNYGYFALKALDKLKPKKIICYDPNTICCDIFGDILEKNNINNIDIINSGVGGITRDAFLNVGEMTVLGEISENKPDEGYPVTIISINDVLDSIGEETVGFLKIDCEGAEKEIFEEITDINLAKIKIIALEYHTQDIRKSILERLEQSELFEFIQRGEGKEIGIIIVSRK